jgi:hypothetical protein
MRSRATILLLLLLLAIPMRRGFAITATLSASQDTTIYQDHTSYSDGQGPDMYVGKTGTKASFFLRRGLIEFDLSSIPAGATITGASLSLTMTKSGPSSGTADPISLYQVLAPWGEAPPPGSNAPADGGAGVPAATNDATWTYRFFNTTQMWTTPGGDFDAVASATKNVSVYGGTPIGYTWAGAGLTGDVQEWVNNPSTNFGWIIRGDETKADDARRFESAESTLGGGIYRPKLTVNYTIPEPGSAALVFAGGVWLALRRRWK